MAPAVAGSLALRTGLSRRGGFTLVELVIVIVVTGILGAVAAPRFFDRGSFDSLAVNDQFKSLLRYGQKIAIAQGRVVFVNVASSGISLCYDAACTSRVVPASGNNSGSSAAKAFCGAVSAWACEGVTAGVTVTAPPAIGNFSKTFYFDATGKPFLTADLSPTLTSTFSRLTLTFVGGGNTKSVYVEAETGYVN